MNTEDFCTYEQALALKKLGFRENCLYHYNIVNEFVPNRFNAEDESITVDDLYDSLNKDTLSDIVCDVPTLAQVQKWLREVKDRDVTSIPTIGEFGKKKYRWEVTIFNPDYGNASKTLFSSYEEALSAGITECLKLLEKED